jgi:type IV pilus assembly protein PilE
MKTSRVNRIPGSGGFTLIELMVVIVIVAILATVAIPGYQSQIRKSRRTDAKTALLDLAAREERYSSTHSAYTGTFGDLGYAGDWPQSVGGGFYQITVSFTADTPNAFSAIAEPVSGKGQDKDTDCLTFKIDNVGVQDATGTLGKGCWN